MPLEQMEVPAAAAAVGKDLQVAPAHKETMAGLLTLVTLVLLGTAAVAAVQVPQGLLVALLETEGMGQHHLLQGPL
jgi:hypothetical protein